MATDTVGYVTDDGWWARATYTHPAGWRMGGLSHLYPSRMGIDKIARQGIRSEGLGRFPIRQLWRLEESSSRIMLDSDVFTAALQVIQSGWLVQDLGDRQDYHTENDLEETQRGSGQDASNCRCEVEKKLLGRVQKWHSHWKVTVRYQTTYGVESASPRSSWLLCDRSLYSQRKRHRSTWRSVGPVSGGGSPQSQELRFWFISAIMGSSSQCWPALAHLNLSRVQGWVSGKVCPSSSADDVHESRVDGFIYFNRTFHNYWWVRRVRDSISICSVLRITHGDNHHSTLDKVFWQGPLSNVLQRYAQM